MAEIKDCKEQPPIQKRYEIRDPIHGFVVLNEWEREIIDHPAFQRLRRIRQLGLTEMVYPGATHTRFEHSLGVMHVATRMFDEVVEKREDFLKTELGYQEADLKRDRVLVRLAALLHDIGHAPLSHAAESLMPCNGAGKKYLHTDYSAAVVNHVMRDVIENHPMNRQYAITARDVADFLTGATRLGRSLLWRGLVSSQLDADRADYLLRDSHHIGVAYGKYDLDRLLVTMAVAIDATGSPVLAVEEGGEHAAEGLIIARYMMFTQVYFQHTRRAYDCHSEQALKTLLSRGARSTQGRAAFPPPTARKNVEAYLEWDDWRVMGMIHAGEAGEHGEIIRERKHHRCVYATPEIPSTSDLEFVEELIARVEDKVSFVDRAEESWYKFGDADIPVLLSPGRRDERVRTLSERSAVVRGLKAVNKIRIYVPPAAQERVSAVVQKLRRVRG